MCVCVCVCVYIYIYMYIYIYIYIYTHINKGWLRTNGVNTNGAAAKVMNFDRSGKRYALALSGRYKSRLMGVPKRSLCQKQRNSRRSQ